MKLVVETAATSVTISDRDGYSPDKLDDWVKRATVLLLTADVDSERPS